MRYEVWDATVTDRRATYKTDGAGRILALRDKPRNLCLTSGVRVDITNNAIKRSFWTSRTKLGHVDWWEDTSRGEWWYMLSTLNSMRCTCGISHDPLMMSVAYGGIPNCSALRGSIREVPFSVAHTMKIDLSRCCVCRPLSFRLLASIGTYISHLRTVNFTREIFGKKTCLCMGCSS